jgi:hypothetical protein
MCCLLWLIIGPWFHVDHFILLRFPNIFTESASSLGTPADESVYIFGLLIHVSETEKYIKN